MKKPTPPPLPTRPNHARSAHKVHATAARLGVLLVGILGLGLFVLGGELFGQLGAVAGMVVSAMLFILAQAFLGPWSCSACAARIDRGDETCPSCGATFEIVLD
ncbi:MAG: hypothetical protein U0271_15375 [Polyangiaceae bacterium]